MIEFINISLFIFWISGIISVLVDMDHIWRIMGRKPPINYSKWNGRPLHTSIVFFCIAILCGFFVCTFVLRFYVQMATTMGELGILGVLCYLNIGTFIGLKIFDKIIIRKGLNEGEICRHH
jgi:hypothetical protein